MQLRKERMSRPVHVRPNKLREMREYRIAMAWGLHLLKGRLGRPKMRGSKTREKMRYR